MRVSSILTYHSIDPSGSVISTAPAEFSRQMAFLAGSGIPVVPLAEVASTPGAAAITFDDGFRNFREQALPVLRRHGLPATVFVVSGHCGRANDWPSQPAGIPKLEIMDWDELREVAAEGIELGAHTVTHPRLSQLPGAAVERELRENQCEIEQQTGRAVTTLAYPYGDSSPTVRRAAAQYFQTACGTELDFVSAGADPYDLPRIDTFYVRNRFWFDSLGTASGIAYMSARRVLRHVRQSFTR